uniref:Clathrin light chain n=1 Tax=Alexandrium catenella TaxID=2925 RepID=A0A7S1Q1Q5_ALECA
MSADPFAAAGAPNGMDFIGEPAPAAAAAPMAAPPADMSVSPMAANFEMPAAGGGFDMPTASQPVISPGAAADFEDPFSGVPVPAKDAGGSRPAIPEVNALREWEDKHERDLEEKAQKEQSEKKDRQATAGNEMAAWLKERDEETEKRKSSNRSAQQAAEASKTESVAGLNPWERVADLIDTRGVAADNGRDTSRMRALLIQLKTSPVVSAA